MKTIDIKHVLKTTSSNDNRITIDNFQDIISIVQFHPSSSHSGISKTSFDSARQLNENVHANASNTGNHNEELAPSDLTDINAFIMILVEEGEVEISFDYKTYYITSDKLAFIIPNNAFRITKMSNDFNARFLIIDRLFFEEIMQERKGTFNYISFTKNPVIRLEVDEKADLLNIFLLLQEKIKLPTHFFHKEMIHNITVTLFLDFLNVLAAKNSDLIHTMFSRQEDLVDKFFKLLAEYAREQHLLSFYANKLFITPKYLSVVLKKLTGKTGSKWINETLVFEAKKLIKSPSSNIQEVAYALNFNDQSAFGRFFKKSMGVSPLFYRRS